MKKSKLMKMIMSLALVIAVVFAVTAPAMASGYGYVIPVSPFDNDSISEIVTTTVDEILVGSFVTRLYNACLDRQPDEYGYNEWVRRLVSDEWTAAEVAQGFIFSQELRDKAVLIWGTGFGLDAYTFLLIHTQYLSLMGRAPAREEIDIWMERSKKERENGKSWETICNELFKHFVESVEFNEICNNYGIEPGYNKIKPISIKEPTPGLEKAKYVSMCSDCGWLYIVNPAAESDLDVLIKHKEVCVIGNLYK